MFDFLFGWIAKLLKKVLEILKKALPYILLAAAIWLSMGMGIPLPMMLGGAIEGTVANALLAVGASFLLAPEETAEVLGDAVGALGEAAQVVLDTVVDVGAGVLSSVLDQPLVFLAGGLALWYFLSRRDERQIVVAAQNPEVA